jgi:hypothetical protein
MGALSLDSKSLRLAIAAVLAFFSFLVAFFIVSDRLGGWPLGYVVAFAIATMIFLAVLADCASISREVRYVTVAREGTAAASAADNQRSGASTRRRSGRSASRAGIAGREYGQRKTASQT